MHCILITNCLGMLNDMEQGRAIKNTVRTAVAYANAEDAALGARYVKDILEAELEEGEGASEQNRRGVLKELENWEGLINFC